MNLTEVLVEALRAVDEAQVPAELREIAFAKAIDLATRGQGAPHGAGVTTTITPPPGAAASTDGSPLQRIAGKLKVDVEAVGHVYNIDPDGQLELVISQNRLPSGYGPAMKDIALLVAAGRQAAGLDTDWTPTEAIREVCEHFNRLDSANFATHINRMDDVFLFRGSARKREVKMTVPGWESEAARVRQLAQIG